MGGQESLVLSEATPPTVVCFQNLFVLLSSNLNLLLFPLNSLDLYVCRRDLLGRISEYYAAGMEFMSSLADFGRAGTSKEFYSPMDIFLYVISH